jgi:hypothetical protein
LRASAWVLSAPFTAEPNPFRQGGRCRAARDPAQQIVVRAEILFRGLPAHLSVAAPGAVELHLPAGGIEQVQRCGCALGIQRQVQPRLAAEGREWWQVHGLRPAADQPGQRIRVLRYAARSPGRELTAVQSQLLNRERAEALARAAAEAPQGAERQQGIAQLVSARVVQVWAQPAGEGDLGRRQRLAQDAVAEVPESLAHQVLKPGAGMVPVRLPRGRHIHLEQKPALAGTVVGGAAEQLSLLLVQFPKRRTLFAAAILQHPAPVQRPPPEAERALDRASADAARALAGIADEHRRSDLVAGNECSSCSTRHRRLL